MKKVRLTAFVVFLLTILCACESWKNQIPGGDYLWVSEAPYIWIDTSEDSRVLLEEYDGSSGGSAWASYGNPGEIILEDGTTRRIAVSFSTVRPCVTFFTYEDEKWTERFTLDCEFEDGEFTVLFYRIQDRTLVDAFFGDAYNELVFRRKDTQMG